jgi:hypothetical protein
MIHPKLLMASAIIASAITVACSDTTAPNKTASEGSSPASTVRSGALHITKECSAYGGVAGDHCTIIASSLPQVSLDSRVYYLSAADLEHGTYDGNVELRVNHANVAFGHCIVTDLFATVAHTIIGRCSFSGGTGRFKGFRAQIVVSVGDDPLWADWNGTYGFSPGE